MKIKINEYESYEINIDNEISIIELNGLVDRLRNIIKMNQHEIYSSSIPNRKTYGPRQKYSREDVVKMLTISHIKGLSDIDKDAQIKNIGSTLKSVRALKKKWIQNFNIQEKEFKK